MDDRKDEGVALQSSSSKTKNKSPSRGDDDSSRYDMVLIIDYVAPFKELVIGCLEHIVIFVYWSKKRKHSAHRRIRTDEVRKI